MFERRLRIFMGLLFLFGMILLGRAFQLQVFAHSQWQKEAESLGHRRHLVETSRGTIKDYKGHDIAVDEPCIDACVEYGAIARDPEWVKQLALKRIAKNQPGVYRRSDEATRTRLLKDAQDEVLGDIDNIWSALARESRQPLEKIEEIRMAVEQRVQIRERYLQYVKFQKASAATTQPASRPTPWFKRVLSAGSNGAVSIDTFEFKSDEQDMPHPIVRNISSDTYMRLAKDIEKYPGLVLKQGAVRRYPYGRAACHVLGYLVVASDTTIGSPENEHAGELREYLPNDFIGRSGIEQLAEPALRGTRGYIEYPAGRKEEILLDQKALPGNVVHATIDIELQSQIQGFFQHATVVSNKEGDKRTEKVPMHGACVIIDIPTNEVRVMASYPDFDPNLMKEKFNELAADHLNIPMLNRATHVAHEPGSTVKPLVGIGAITQGIWTTRKGIECTGYLVINGKQQSNGKCWTASFLHDPTVGGNIGHHQFPVKHRGVFGNPDGTLVFADAIERSCNVYFETLADKMGPEVLGFWFSRFGLGHETGLGISESRGQVPRAEDRFPPSLTWFSGIGQTRVLATPVQMANAVATIARDGIWMKPRLVTDRIPLAPVPLRGGRVLPDKEDLKLDPEAVAAAKDGMVRVVNDVAGTGFKGAHMDEILLAGKTGTAQGHEQYEMDADGHPLRDPKTGNRVALVPATIDHPTTTPWYRGWGNDGNKFNHAWFVGFAPADHPKIAIAVMVEHGGGGGTAAGAIAKQALTACAEHGYLQFQK